MKLTILLLTITVFNSFATQSYSQNTKFTIVQNNAMLEKVLKEVEQQSEFRFFYNEKVNVEKRININIRQKDIHELLDKIFQQTDISYEIIGHQIALFPKIAGKKNTPQPQPIVQPQKKTITIKGKITGKNNETLPGVSILVKGTTHGAVSDENGYYTIELPTTELKNAQLVISYVSYLPQTIPVHNQTIINIILKPDIKELDEIVVLAYGAQKKVAVTGAINTVSTKELTKSSSANLANALAGKLAGLTSMQNGGGQPGMDNATLYLRGAATLNDNSPLIMIDGVPRSNIRTLDANEVESISILKDASATAVFGVRGANGVILITTKRGAEGKAQLNLNVMQSYTSFTREPSRLHSTDYLKLRNEAFINDGEGVHYSDNVIAKYQNPLAGLDPSDPDYATKANIRKYMYPDHNYYRELIRRYTPETRVDMNISGGTKQLSYFTNASYLHQGGNLNTEPKSLLGYDPAAKMDRFTFRSNLDYNITKSLSAFLNLGSYIERVNMPSASLYGGDTNWMMTDLIYQAQTILPITPGPTTIDGFGVAPGQVIDPGYLDRTSFEIMNRKGFRKDTRSNLNSSLGATWDLSKLVTPGLNLKGMISYDSYAGTSMDGAKSEPLYRLNIDYNADQLTYFNTRPDEQPLIVSKSSSSNFLINLQGSVNYNQKFGLHEVGGMILAQRDYWNVTGGSSTTLIPYNVIGMAGRATYAYNNRYFGEFDMGYNGSEQFAPNHRFGFFPAFSASWVLSNEQFLKDNSFITNLKLRASCGKVGNDKMGGQRFLYLDHTEMSANGNTLGSLGNEKGQGQGQCVAEGLRGNPYLSWESSMKKNLGVDFQFFKDLSGSFDYFKENRSKILISRNTVPEFQGVDLSYIPYQNMGIVYNRGWEAVLNYQKSITKDFSFAIRGNYSNNHNVVKCSDEVLRDETYVYRTRIEGHPLNQCWGYMINWKDKGGYWVSTDEIKNSGLTYGFGASPRVGDFKYIDQNGDKVIDEKDQVPIGYSTIPRVNYGASLDVNFMNFDFSIFFQGVGKYSRYYNGPGVVEYTKNGTYFDYTRNAWTLERYLNGEKITYPALSTHATSNHVPNDFFIMNRAFTRLKNIELGYTLPKEALRVIGVSQMRLSVGGQNLYVWDHLRMGHLDPENNSSDGYPSTKMINFGLKVTF
ncbi:MAG: TonB-dependent receptor [Bacteroidota bacterium]|nr:TonB-dependent receptor [Bacteroidota bacterium]